MTGKNFFNLAPLLNRLWHHISLQRQRQFLLLLILMILSSFAEILSIGAVLPFLGVLTAPERIFEMPILQPVIHALNMVEPNQLLLPLTIVFVLAALIAGAMRLTLLWASTRLSFATGADLSIDIYRRTLYQPYALHCARNSSVVIDGISSKANGVIYSILMPTLTLISSVAMLIAILIALLIVQPVVAIAAFGGFGFIYIVIILLTRKKLLAHSKCVARESIQVIKSLQEGLGGIRDVLIDRNQEAYCQIYRNADLPLRRAQGSSLFLSASPRFGIEALGMVLIATLTYLLAKNANGISQVLPILGALALGAQRLLPVLQHAYASWAQMKGGQASLSDVLELLDQPLPSYLNQPVIKTLPFNYSIELKEASFRYSLHTPYVIRKINLDIPKGSRVGFMGPTGCGKSTLIDIIMGLLQPTDGLLEVDGKAITLANQSAWQAHIAHVPQAIFLADTTIEENIAFGVPKDRVDHSRIRLAAQHAQIADSIEALPEQYQTLVGERGIRLSGGQRQRIGIARALYKQADVIILDEATSALDSETERAVMQAIESLSKELTVIIIAHRLTTLKNCSKLFEIKDGGFRRVGSYQDIANESIE
jgi:ATP-binding cassette subfamily B protein